MAIDGKPTVISTFAGTGGSSLGYHWAGFKELLAIDFDAHAVECFKLNFPDVPIWQRSIIEVTAEEILSFCKLKVGELDVFDGSPPCQGFSTAGKREVRDPRNDLFIHYWRLVSSLQPKVFVMENVSGMAKGTMKGRFIEIMKTLKSGDYNVKAKQMNAMYYGVPQSRERVIFIGVRKDLRKEAVFPNPSSKTISVKDALGLDGFIKYRRSYSKSNVEIAESSLDKPSLTITKTPSWTICLIPKERYRIAMARLKPGENLSSTKEFNGSLFNYVRAPLEKPCMTIPKSCTYGGVSVYHPIEERNLTIDEAKVLCSFPIEWKMAGKYTDQWARLGNAVMPKFMEAIATTIKTEIL